jgi:hypothetical protein
MTEKISANSDDERSRQEFENFSKAIGKENDTTMLVLRAHLFAENLMERIIQVSLPRGDKIIENGSYTFAQKLALIDALEIIKDSIVSSLRNLNKLRNQCAHDLSKTIGDADVTRVGSPLGQEFTRARHKFNNNPHQILVSVISYICGYLAATCTSIEEKHVALPTASIKQNSHAADRPE